jgi:hypothetical protein
MFSMAAATWHDNSYGRLGENEGKISHAVGSSLQWLHLIILKAGAEPDAKAGGTNTLASADRAPARSCEASAVAEDKAAELAFG